MTTCLSCGCNDVARSINFTALEEKTTSAANSFNALYNMSDYNLSTDEECTLLKANIMSYIGKYDLLQDEYYQELEKIVTSEANYNEVIGYQNSLIRSDLSRKLKAIHLSNLTMEYDNHGVLNLGETYNVLPNVDDLIPNHPIQTYSQPRRIGMDMNYEYNFGGGGGGGNSPTEKISKQSCNENNISLELNGIIEGNNFLGLICTPDTCKYVYNKGVDIINGIFESVDMYEEKKMLKQLITMLITAASPSAAYLAIVKNALFSKIKNFFLEAFIMCGSSVLGWIVGILCLFVVVGVLTAVIAMFICGYYGCGYAIGWIIRSVLDREWVATILH